MQKIVRRMTYATFSESEPQTTDVEGSDENEAPSSSNIDIYLRIRPVAEAWDGIQIGTEESDVRFTIPRKSSHGYEYCSSIHQLTSSLFLHVKNAPVAV